MSIAIYQVDAFTDAPFAGNPAAVCFPPSHVDDRWLAHVAAEMNLSETAFLWPENGGHRLRWLTPRVEVDLCGHATLASAHILWERGHEGTLRFFTRSGELTAERRGDAIELDFPATNPEPTQIAPAVLAALGIDRAECFRSRHDYMLVLDREEQVRALKPDFGALRALPVRGIIVTAPSDGPQDFVSRFFAPGAGVDEDPVTGSAHCALGPYYRRRLEKNPVVGYQASERGGVLEVEIVGDRVKLRGRAVTVLRGELVCDPS